MTAIATIAVTASLITLAATASDAVVELAERVRNPRRGKLLS